MSNRWPLPATVSFLIILHGHFIHSNTRLHLGILRVFFADNRFHRIHHSVQPEHFDKNFGSATTVWDRLFGTAHFPSRTSGQQPAWPARTRPTPSLR
jgi:sterol desaturase/sphingolipid hydroxylase (fatty acid hydroxylase superfamily)